MILVVAWSISGCGSVPPSGNVEVFVAKDDDPAHHMALGHRLGSGHAHGVGCTSGEQHDAASPFASVQAPPRAATFDRGVLHLTDEHGRTERIEPGTPFAGTSPAMVLAEVRSWSSRRVSGDASVKLEPGPFRFEGTLSQATVGRCEPGAEALRTVDGITGVVVGVVTSSGVHAHLLAEAPHSGRLVDLGRWGPGTLERPAVLGSPP